MNKTQALELAAKWRDRALACWNQAALSEADDFTADKFMSEGVAYARCAFELMAVIDGAKDKEAAA